MQLKSFRTNTRQWRIFPLRLFKANSASYLRPMSPRTASNSSSEALGGSDVANGGADVFANRDATDVAGDFHVENHNGQLVVHGKGNGGGVQDFNATIQNFQIGNL